MKTSPTSSSALAPPSTETAPSSQSPHSRNSLRTAHLLPQADGSAHCPILWVRTPRTKSHSNEPRHAGLQPPSPHAKSHFSPLGGQRGRDQLLWPSSLCIPLPSLGRELFSGWGLWSSAWSWTPGLPPFVPSAECPRSQPFRDWCMGKGACGDREECGASLALLAPRPCHHTWP